jgi:predicted DNA-binding transcriptional regulator YafY
MRLEKAAMLLRLARTLASSSEGMTLDEMAETLGMHRRTAQRFRNALESLFPQIEEIADGKSKRWRLSSGLDNLYRSPSAEELATLAITIDGLRRQGAAARAAHLESLAAKVKTAMRGNALSKVAPDLDALVRAECIVAPPMPGPHEDEFTLTQVRQALLAMRKLQFTYPDGEDNDDGRAHRRRVTPFGIVIGWTNYLVGVADDADAPEHWRFDLMGEVEITTEHGAPPAGFDVREHVLAYGGHFSLSGADASGRR